MTSSARRRDLRFVLLIGAVVIGSLHSAVSAAESPAVRLHALFDAEWERAMRESPTWASSLGDLRYNDRWDDLSLDAMAASHAADHAVLSALDAVQLDQLSSTDRINYRLFRQKYELRVAEYVFQWYLVPLNQRGGIQDAGDLADALSFDRVQDYEDWLARMRAFPEQVDQTIALMRLGAERKIIHSRIVMQRLPAQIDKQITDNPQTHLFFKPFRSYPGTIPAADQQRLTAEAERIVRDVIVPEYRKFKTFFEETYLPACHPEVGVWQVPRGDELYALRCREFTTTDLTPDQIHQIGLGEVDRIRKEMEAIVAEVGWQGTFAEFLEHLRSDPQFYFEDPNELLEAYRSVCKRVDPQLVKLFKLLPRMPYGVEAIPEHIAPDTTTAYYRPPAADGSRAGTYFVNLYRPEVRPKYEIEAAVAARGGAGAPFADRPRSGDSTTSRSSAATAATPRTSKAGRCTRRAWGANWGCTRIRTRGSGSYTYEMWRAVRLVVDTGIHHQHWTRQQAIDFFTENTAKTLLRHRERSRPLHRLAGTGAGLQDRRTADPVAPPQGRGPTR